MKKSLLVLALSGFINSAYASTYAAAFGFLGLGSGSYLESVGATAHDTDTITVETVPEADSNALMLTGIVMLGLIIRKKLS